MRTYWNLFVSVMSTVMVMYGLYYWYVQDTHEMTYSLLIAILLNQTRES
jgi:hypothetical protein